MTTLINDTSDALRRWMGYYISSHLYGDKDDQDILDQLILLGTVIDDMRERNPERFELVTPIGSDPLEIIKEAWDQAIKLEGAPFPGADFEFLATVGQDALKAVNEQDEKDDPPTSNPADEHAPKPTDEPTPEPTPPAEPVEEEDIDGWTISLFLRKIHCKKETEVPLFGDAGKDEFRLFGTYQYLDGLEPLKSAYGEFDSRDQKTYYQFNNGNGLLLATEDIDKSTEYRKFDVNIMAFEDDGMSDANARLLASIIGNLATLGVNGLMSSVPIPANVSGEVRRVYQNLGLPGLIGYLSKIFGPEPFIPVKCYAKTKWPPTDLKNPPKWIAKMPSPGGKRRPHIGEGFHGGNVTLLEAELKETAGAAGTSDYELVHLSDGAIYYIYMRLVVEKS